MAIGFPTLWHASLRHPAGNTPLPEGEPCIYFLYVCLWNFRLFSIISLRTRTFSQNAKSDDTGKPSGTCGRGLSSIRAL